MKRLVRLFALCALCSSVDVRATPAVPPPPRDEAPLSCLPAAKPFFARAWEALSNAHADDARELFAQTVAVDPGCVLAWAHLGALTPGAQGRRMVDDAVSGSGAVSEVERFQVQALAAQHRGDAEQSLTLWRKARELVPRSYELNFIVAQRAAVLQLWHDAADAARRATELRPERGAAWNVLGYAYMGLRRPEAVAAFQRYAEVAPLEPNAHDSLGDALLAHDQLDDARAAYQRALDTSGGSFWASGHGVATACALQQDWFCARAAIEKARRTAPQADDKLRLMEWTAWSYLADGQPAEAFRALEDLEQDARRLKVDARAVGAVVLRGRFLIHQGRYQDGLVVLQALGKQRWPALLEGQKLALEAGRLHAVTEAQARLGQVREAEKTLGVLRALFDSRPRDVQGLDRVAHARGLIALQKKDPALAISALQLCSEGADACRLDLAAAQEAAGDGPAAANTRTLISRANHRDPEYWWVRIRALTPSRASPGLRDEPSL